VKVWDVYLDADDAATLLAAAEILERNRWVREPLPWSDVARLLERLRKIADIAEEDARHWRFEAEDRLEESRGDGGRWGDPEVATRMAVTALALADGSREVHEAARAAAEDLAARIEQQTRVELS
jgi:hypothetical protein